jgi:hypothetical protein
MGRRNINDTIGGSKMSDYSDGSIKSDIDFLKRKIINVSDVFVYNYPVYKVTLDCKYWYYICCNSKQDALDGVIDYLEDKKELDRFIYSDAELEEMSDRERDGVQIAGNHCHELDCSVEIEVIYGVCS